MNPSDIDAVIQHVAEVNATDQQVREATGTARALGVQKALEYLDQYRVENANASNGATQ
jgi:hypothetical protein